MYQPTVPQPSAQVALVPAAAPGMPPLPWETPLATAPEAAIQPTQQAPQFDPRGFAEAQAAIVRQALAPMQQEIERVKVENASIQLESKISQMQSRYGPEFNPRETVAYALAHKISDMDQAFRGVLGERTYRQRYLQPVPTAPTAPNSYQAAPAPTYSPGPSAPGPSAPGPSAPTAPTGYSAQSTPPMATPQYPSVVTSPGARVEPPRGRPQNTNGFPPGYVAKDYHESSQMALQLMRGNPYR